MCGLLAIMFSINFHKFTKVFTTILQNAQVNTIRTIYLHIVVFKGLQGFDANMGPIQGFSGTLERSFEIQVLSRVFGDLREPRSQYVTNKYCLVIAQVLKRKFVLFNKPSRAH